MTDIAADLKDRFWVVELDLHEKWELREMLPPGETIPDVLIENEHRAMDILKACRESVDAIPEPLLNTAKEFLESGPVLFERTAMRITGAIGFGFYPENATKFVELLNDNLQRIGTLRRSTLTDIRGGRS
jgi:hypothetical protein